MDFFELPGNDVCIHIANLFYLASFLGRDMLWLRLLQCCGLVFGIFFFTACQAAPMYGPTFWHVAFLVINFYQIRFILIQRQRLKLSREQQVIRNGMMAGLSDRELVNTLAKALHSDEDHIRVVSESNEHVLTADEIAFRDIALKQLSRGDLINLLSRQTWRSLEKLQPKWAAGDVSHM